MWTSFNYSKATSADAISGVNYIMGLNKLGINLFLVNMWSKWPQSTGPSSWPLSFRSWPTQSRQNSTPKQPAQRIYPLGGRPSQARNLTPSSFSAKETWSVRKYFNHKMSSPGKCPTLAPPRFTSYELRPIRDWVVNRLAKFEKLSDQNQLLERRNSQKRWRYCPSLNFYTQSSGNRGKANINLHK